MRRILLILLAILAGAGCNSYAQIGDSITHMCASQISAATGGFAYGVNGSRLEPGGNFDWQHYVSTLPATDKTDRIVVGLGTNDAVIFKNHLPSDWPYQIDRMVWLLRKHLNPGGRIYWVNVEAWIGYGHSTPTAGQTVNVALAAGAIRDGYKLIDWSSVAASKPGLIGDDGVHPTEAGCEAYAGMITKETA